MQSIGSGEAISMDQITNPGRVHTPDLSRSTKYTALIWQKRKKKDWVIENKILYQKFASLRPVSHLDNLASVWQRIKIYLKRWRTLNY